MKQSSIHKTALVAEDVSIGNRTRIWAFTNILSNVNIGEDCNICDHCFIENDVSIGNNVTIKTHVSVWTGVTIEDNVFIGPSVVFSNDVYPRSKQYPEKYAATLLKKGCSIGAGAVLLPNIEVGEWAMVGAGSIVTRSVLPHALVVGNPARQIGWVCQCGKKISTETRVVSCDCGKKYRVVKNRLELEV
jgi:acetyltransferase-like isoleucine patch superfamily enzyme